MALSALSPSEFGRRSRAPHSRGARVLAALALIGMLLSFLFVVPASAQSTNADFEVLSVDLSRDPATVVLRTPREPGEDPIVIEVGGEAIPNQTSTLATSIVDSYVVLVVDDSANADVIAGFPRIREAAKNYLSRVPAGTQVMLVRGGGGNPDAEALVAFTTNHERVREALDAMVPEGGSVMWNAISRSGEAMPATANAVRSVVAFAASPGGASTVSPDFALGNILNGNADLTLVLPTAPNTDFSAYQQVAASVPGSAEFRGNGDDTMIEAGLAAGTYHRQTFVAAFDPGLIESGTSEMAISFAGSRERVRVVPGVRTTGDSLIAPEIATKSRFEILQSDTAATVAIGAGVVAALLFSFALMQIFAGADNTLNNTLAVYSPDEHDEESRAADDAFASVRSRIVEQVVEKAETAAASTGKLENTTSMLQKAEIPLRPGEAMAVQVGLVMLGLLLGYLLSGGVGALAFGVVAAIAPTFYVKYKVSSRKKKLEAQLPDVLTLLASTLKAGYSFLQGIDAVGNEAAEPLAGEFRRTVNEARLGRDIDDALDDLAERVGSTDLLWAVVAIKIQREVGGNLAELLMTVADTMTARTRLRGEVQALTAEGRMSAYVLVLLPIGVGVAMYMLNKDYISTLWSHSLGYAALGAGVLGMIVGSLWMRKIIDISI